MDCELLQATLSLPELREASAHAQIVAAVQAQPGVHNVEIVQGSLRVLYDPLLLTEHELETAIRGSGHVPGKVEVDRDSFFAP